MPSACWARSRGLRRRGSPRPTWCAIRWSRASSRPTTRPAQSAPDAERMTARPALSLSLQLADGRHRGALARADVARWIRAAIAAPAEITVRVVDDTEGRRLNREFRGIDHATNVLTFPYAT